jgi:hypothetical protein
MHKFEAGSTQTVAVAVMAKQHLRLQSCQAYAAHDAEEQQA